MKYISPGGWFSLEYPMGWHEFEDTEESFLFYNPDRWTGNFRISAYKDEAADYGPQCIAYELKENTSSTLVKVGKWDCAYSAETFQEEGAWYTTHIWGNPMRKGCANKNKDDYILYYQAFETSDPTRLFAACAMHENKKAGF